MGFSTFEARFGELISLASDSLLVYVMSSSGTFDFGGTIKPLSEEMMSKEAGGIFVSTGRAVGIEEREGREESEGEEEEEEEEAKGSTVGISKGVDPASGAPNGERGLGDAEWRHLVRPEMKAEVDGLEGQVLRIYFVKSRKRESIGSSGMRANSRKREASWADVRQTEEAAGCWPEKR